MSLFPYIKEVIDKDSTQIYFINQLYGTVIQRLQQLFEVSS
jgi:hypothetical protein